MNLTREKLAQLLAQLNTSFEPYSTFWNDWIASGCHSLTFEDIYAIRVLHKKNFKPNIEDCLIFYVKKQLLEDIIKKLDTSLTVYKTWLVKQWQHKLCELALKGDFLKFFNSRIDILNLDERLKSILLGFKLKTIREIFLRYSVEDLTSGHIFEKVMNFMEIQNTLKKKTNTHKRPTLAQR